MARFKTEINRETLTKKFWRHVPLERSVDSCWEWQGRNKIHGYGNIQMGSRPYGNYYREFAHRFSYRLHYGDIPEKMFICHSCDNPGCVNPNHLFLGSPKDNVEDALKKGRWGTPAMLSERAKKGFAKHLNKRNKFGQWILEGEDSETFKGRKLNREEKSRLIKAKIPRGEKHYKAKFKQEDIYKILELRAEGRTYKEIAQLYDVDFSTIYKITKRKRWKGLQ